MLTGGVRFIKNEYERKKAMVIIRQKLLPARQAANVTNGQNNTRKYIVVHETDNTNVGADADAHARMQINGNVREASWHWQVDESEAVQSFEHYWACWAAGTPSGNNEGIHVEICVNSDGDFNVALQNAASLIAKIIKDEKITIENVVQHNYFSGKNCPRYIRAGKVSWTTFLQMVSNASPIQPDNTAQDSKKYRIITGFYRDQSEAEKVVEVMRNRFGWIAYVEQDKTGFRIKTGTFTGIVATQNAVNKIKNAGLAQVTYVVEE